MSHQDKFWEKFGRKIRQHQPEGYTDGAWKDMEQLLNGTATQPPRRKNRALLPLILLAAVAGYLAGAWYGWPSTPEAIGAFPIPMQGIARGEMPGFTPNHQTDELAPLPDRGGVGTATIHRENLVRSLLQILVRAVVRLLLKAQQ